MTSLSSDFDIDRESDDFDSDDDYQDSPELEQEAIDRLDAIAEAIQSMQRRELTVEGFVNAKRFNPSNTGFSFTPTKTNSEATNLSAKGFGKVSSAPPLSTNESAGATASFGVRPPEPTTQNNNAPSSEPKFKKNPTNHAADIPENAKFSFSASDTSGSNEEADQQPKQAFKPKVTDELVTDLTSDQADTLILNPDSEGEQKTDGTSSTAEPTALLSFSEQELDATEADSTLTLGADAPKELEVELIEEADALTQDSEVTDAAGKSITVEDLFASIDSFTVTENSALKQRTHEIPPSEGNVNILKSLGDSPAGFMLRGKLNRGEVQLNQRQEIAIRTSLAIWRYLVRFTETVMNPAMVEYILLNKGFLSFPFSLDQHLTDVHLQGTSALPVVRCKNFDVNSLPEYLSYASCFEKIRSNLQLEDFQNLQALTCTQPEDVVKAATDEVTNQSTNLQQQLYAQAAQKLTLSPSVQSELGNQQKVDISADLNRLTQSSLQAKLLSDEDSGRLFDTNSAAAEALDPSVSSSNEQNRESVTRLENISEHELHQVIEENQSVARMVKNSITSRIRTGNFFYRPSDLASALKVKSFNRQEQAEKEPAKSKLNGSKLLTAEPRIIVESWAKNVDRKAIFVQVDQPRFETKVNRPLQATASGRLPTLNHWKMRFKIGPQKYKLSLKNPKRFAKHDPLSSYPVTHKKIVNHLQEHNNQQSKHKARDGLSWFSYWQNLPTPPKSIDSIDLLKCPTVDAKRFVQQSATTILGISKAVPMELNHKAFADFSIPLKATLGWLRISSPSVAPTQKLATATKLALLAGNAAAEPIYLPDFLCRSIFYTSSQELLSYSQKHTHFKRWASFKSKRTVQLVKPDAVQASIELNLGETKSETKNMLKLPNSVDFTEPKAHYQTINPGEAQSIRFELLHKLTYSHVHKDKTTAEDILVDFEQVSKALTNTYAPLLQQTVPPKLQTATETALEVVNSVLDSKLEFSDAELMLMRYDLLHDCLEIDFPSLASFLRTELSADDFAYLQLNEQERSVIDMIVDRTDTSQVDKNGHIKYSFFVGRPQLKFLVQLLQARTNELFFPL